jgi:hypothetical protein
MSEPMTREQAIERFEFLIAGPRPNIFEQVDNIELFKFALSALRAQQNHICPLLSDSEVQQPCIEGPCPAYYDEPLTLEELKERDGKSVWIRDIGDSRLSGWHLVNSSGDGYVICKNGWKIPFSCLGHSRLAYDHKPKEAEKS